MKAVRLLRAGGPASVDVADIERPPIAPGKILVAVRAAGVNPFDWKLTTGMIPVGLPFVLGGDFSGVIESVGPGVDDFHAGDEVFGGASRFSGGSGSFAEYALASVETVARKPRSLDFLHASALPLAGVSALQALTEHIELTVGQKILIHGGAGGIGTMAIQLAQDLGAYIATTVKAEQADFVQRFGADLVIDYEKVRFEEPVKDFDAVFDTVGGETYRRSIGVLKKGGVLVSMVEKPDEEAAKARGIRAIGQTTRVTRARLEALARLADERAISVHIDRVFPLESAGDALAHLKDGHPMGKVVLQWDPIG
ncbi:MAG: NADP-dependent oxidoreductase [Candidatus Eisenbacteria bacterium]|nr:NADP-dependent oxidoreductase [Candidatus Eisenbacteria bacterium]